MNFFGWHISLETCESFIEDVKIGINWYHHSKRLPWRGFTFQFILLTNLIHITIVSDRKIYDDYMNGRWHKKKFE